ncbi:OmpW family outer membrane protein [Psychroserpens sp. Hel_I_66]|uniref:OmpW family outer membrane protein n=1 Tax=Psychroserpens sp. Hel_I_66 TaxID=1250004 RepID=UPI000648D64F|nr:OmpW family outer membrane protein [Psychroserpens sp. Hel_I_66]
MKKLLLMAAVAVFGLSNVNAQEDLESKTTKGTWLFGTDAGISFASNKTTAEFDGQDAGFESTVSTFSITPSANYFIIDNLAIGLDLLFSSSKEEEEFDGFGETFTDEFKTSTFAAIPNATYFFGDGSFRPYLGAGVGYLSTGSDEDITKFSGLVIKGQGGVAYFINSSVALNFGVEYLNANLKNKEESDFENKSNTFGVGLGFSFFL